MTKHGELKVTLEPAKPKRPRRKAEYILLQDAKNPPAGAGQLNMMMTGGTSQQDVINKAKASGMKGTFMVVALLRTIEIEATTVERLTVKDLN